MKFTQSLACEALKLKGSLILYISAIGGVLLAAIFTMRHLYIGHHINQVMSDTAWQALFSQNARAFIGFLMPIGGILICTLITQIEYKNNNWKQVHTTPQSLSTIFFAKFSILFALTVLVFCLLNIGILLNGAIPCLVLDGQWPTTLVPSSFFITETLKCFAFALPIIGFQYLLSLHFKNFMIPFALGLTIYVGSMPAINLGSISMLSPYSFVLNYFDLKTNSTDVYIALLYFLVLFVGAYISYLRKSEKG